MSIEASLRKLITLTEKQIELLQRISDSPRQQALTLNEINNLCGAAALKMNDDGMSIRELMLDFNISSLTELKTSDYIAFVERIEAL